MRDIKNYLLGFFLLVLIISCGKKPDISNNPKDLLITSVWSADKANKWYAQHPWLSGANYIPSTAVNQLEMWQENTFDQKTIDKELGWAESIGFNTMRVFLHSLAWKQDQQGFKKRMDKFLAIASKHHIEPMFVFFDDCWNKFPQIGVQPAPLVGVHNSGWVQDPGQLASADSTTYPELKRYVKDILSSFGHDKRILMWDLYNEPGNSNKGEGSLQLLTKVFTWAREVNPDQPISAGLWAWNFEKLKQFQIMHSDVITYHDYEEPAQHLKIIQSLKIYGRQIICTEYMARTLNSRFANIMPMLQKENIGAISWGLVAGKTNTIYTWDTPILSGAEPIEWFHDIFRQDGTPYRKDETDLIKKINGVK